jgi:hypothetical protein
LIFAGVSIEMDDPSCFMEGAYFAKIVFQLQRIN